MKIYLLFSPFLILSLLFVNNFGIIVTAHNFDTDDNSTFLTLINMILIENQIINNSLVDSSTNARESLLYDSVDNINEIIDDILISEDSLLVDSDQFYNNTIIATMMANLGDEVLRKYGYAFGIPSNVMLNMNFSLANRLEMNSSQMVDTSNHSSHDSPDLGNQSVDLLKDKYQYNNALETSKRMIEIYEEELESRDTTFQDNNDIPLLKKSLHELKENIENISQPSKIMEIVHGKVHPNLQTAFNLTLKQ
ncbi:MAG: hypothetical protein L0H53_16560 [Candidatus Nitrosocosmicus sp.]|nr:hypothetical protein [Candidatus Nitrosocosmicus sp.]MDN5867742.1 hypothetical protein [Candidatus Nitrosocosmicus sp.]